MVAKNQAVEVRRVYNTNVYDLFFGKGWDDWTRVMAIKGHLIQTGGRKRSEDELKVAQQAIKENNDA